MVFETLTKPQGQRMWTGEFKVRESERFNPHRDNRIYTTGETNTISENTLTPFERFLIAYQADGSTNPTGNSNGTISSTLMYSFRFKKDRKIQRLFEILEEVAVR